MGNKEIAIFELTCASVSKRVFVQNLLHENKHLGGAYFHVNGFVQRLALGQTQKETQKWYIKIT